MPVKLLVRLRCLGVSVRPLALKVTPVLRLRLGQREHTTRAAVAQRAAL